MIIRPSLLIQDDSADTITTTGMIIPISTNPVTAQTASPTLTFDSSVNNKNVENIQLVSSSKTKLIDLTTDTDSDLGMPTLEPITSCDMVRALLPKNLCDSTG